MAFLRRLFRREPEPVKREQPRIKYNPGCDGPYDYEAARRGYYRSKRQTPSGRPLPLPSRQAGKVIDIKERQR